MLVAVLSAAQLLPTFDLMEHGDRSSSFDTSTWSLPLWGVANFFVPLFRCTPSVAGVWTADQQQWTSSYYTGLVTLLLGAIAVIKARQLKTLLLAVVVVTGIVFAMGDVAVVLKLVKAVFPVLGFIRYPIKYIALTIFALPAGGRWSRLPSDSRRFQNDSQSRCRNLHRGAGYSIQHLHRAGEVSTRHLYQRLTPVGFVDCWNGPADRCQ